MIQPAARLVFGTNPTDKGYILWNGTETYFEKLRSAYVDIKNDKEAEYLYFSFFTLCSATLEYSLNFLLTDYCLNQYGHEDYKQYAEGYINLQFGKKLLMTPTIISNGKYAFKKSHSAYKTLLELIALRNRILHNKEFLKEFDTPPLTGLAEKSIIEFQIPFETNHIDTLTKELCLRIGDALGKFKSFFMTPALLDELGENEMLIKL
jgi:hypothetical protein